MNQAILDVFKNGLLTADEVIGKRVLEVGAYDVNGTVRPIIEALRPASYLAVDMAPGPSVDEIIDCVDLIRTFGHGAFQVVITTEMLEHVKDWKACLGNLIGVTAVGGLLVITTRSPGFLRHDYPGDYWRYTPEVLDSMLRIGGLDVLNCFPDPDSDSPGVIAKARKTDRGFGDLETSLQPEPAP